MTYYDVKGKVRKETSWENWRDKKIDPVDHENTPTSGFVLNKKVGDYVSDWNHRQAYVRVYDPRGFEFEITIENLLYILENANSIKGKGLEGEFIYGWDGKDLVLLPVESPDYKEISAFNTILHEKNYIKSKDLSIGGTYKSKDNKEWIYMGRFDLKDTKSERVEQEKKTNDYWNRTSYSYIYHNINKGKYYFFVREGEYSWDTKSLKLLTVKSLGDRFIECVSSECIPEYSEHFDWLERQTEYSHRDESRDEWVSYSLDEFVERVNTTKFTDSRWGSRFDIYKAPEIREELRYDVMTNQFFKEGKWDKDKTDYEKLYVGNVLDVFNLYEPVYKNEYLENGKIYRRVK
ncbi:hypothetical protein MKY95_18815 [Paenibacillus sp. FSL P4-0176]|uniref:hypothetical protein n=1 Tax=Paenibacillus sp. FSL P4-0176 TaxID=2921631 RepID=UPI0030CE72E5